MHNRVAASQIYSGVSIGHAWLENILVFQLRPRIHHLHLQMARQRRVRNRVVLGVESVLTIIDTVVVLLLLLHDGCIDRVALIEALLVLAHVLERVTHFFRAFRAQSQFVSVHLKQALNARRFVVLVSRFQFFRSHFFIEPFVNEM